MTDFIEEEKLARHNKFEEVKKKADTLAKIIKNLKKEDGEEFNLDDYICFSIITLMNASAISPRFKAPTKYIVNFYVDAQIQIDEEDKIKNNGISLIQG